MTPATKHTDAAEEGQTSTPVSPGAPGQGRTLLRLLAIDRLSGVYAWGLLIIIFGVWLPDTFLTTATFKTISANQAVTALAAMALIIPLTAGLFDLSIAANLGLTAVLTLYLQGHGVSMMPAVAISLAAGTLVGVVNGVVVVAVGVNSFIATLGMSSVLAAAAFLVTNGTQLVADPTSHLVTLGQGTALGISNAVWCALAVAAVLFYVTELTTVGRYLYAIGGNLEAARLVGVRVDRVLFGSLVSSGFLAGLAGVVLSARLGAADSAIGPPYLLPAFSAVLLGATQIKINGRANVGGTLIAVILLATGIYGLQLAGAATWVSDLFNGAALILAVSLSVRAKGRA
ncbi:MAG: ribose transport system permease protein [Solirubrobacteraceae bacterium]|jgi:ribose transport system permease protein|nr:ribose transport system permease protein [Solirubrobacteraceae bacterium]